MSQVQATERSREAKYQSAYRKRLSKKATKQRLQTQYETHLKLLTPIAKRWNITIADLEKGFKHYLEIFSAVGYDMRLYYDQSFFNKHRPHVSEFSLLPDSPTDSDLSSTDLEDYAPLHDLRQTCTEDGIVFLCQCPKCESNLREDKKIE